MSPTFEVTAYRTLWFGLQYDSETVEHGETVGNGALTSIERFSDDLQEKVNQFEEREDALRERFQDAMG